MGRGFLSGLIRGSLLSVLGLGVLSVILPLPEDRVGTGSQGGSEGGEAVAPETPVSDAGTDSGGGSGDAEEAGVTPPEIPTDPSPTQAGMPDTEPAQSSTASEVPRPAATDGPARATVPDAAGPADGDESVPPGDGTAPPRVAGQPDGATETAPRRAQPTGLARAAEESLPNPGPIASGDPALSDPAGTASADPGSGGDIASAVVVPSGSEFRRAPADSAARVPSAAPAPLAAIAPVPPGQGAPSDEPAAPEQASSRPDLPGMSVASPIPPAGDAGDGDALSSLSDSSAPRREAEAAAVQVQPITAPDPDAAREMPPATRLAPVEEGRALQPAIAPSATFATPSHTPTARPEAPLQPVAEAQSRLGPLAGTAAIQAHLSTQGPVVQPARGVTVRPVAASGARSWEEITALAPVAGDRLQPRPDAISRNAAPFSNPDGRPLVAVILRHDPRHDLSAEQIAAVGLPLAVALDRTDPAAPALAQALAAEGIEVVLVASDLPATGGGSLAGAILRGALDEMPQALAVMDPEAHRFTRTARLTEAVQAVAGEEGHGIIGWGGREAPLDSPVEVSAHPTALIFGTLDAADENAERIGRYLSRAAFEAEETGAVVMLGHTRPETLVALSRWAGSEDGSAVAVAPVSAVLDHNRTMMLH